jgi:HEAT repeat protein
MVVPLVDHPSYRVRQAAAWWLARRGASRQVYLSMLNRLSQPDSALARNAADVLGEFRAASAIPALSAALSNPIFSGEARGAVAHALGQIGRPEVATPLTQALADSDPLVKAASLQALRDVEGFHDGMVAVPLVKDADASVRARGGARVRRGRRRTQEGRLVARLHRGARERRRAGAADGGHERSEPLRSLARADRDLAPHAVRAGHGPPGTAPRGTPDA